MPQTARSASSPDGGWRGRKDIAPSTARHLNRVLLTVLAVVLAGALGYLMWTWFSQPKTHVACLSVVRYDRLAVPPIPFAQRDARQLDELSLAEPVAECGEDVQQIGRELAQINSKAADTLIVHLSAHGVSDGGAAYLLCGEFRPERDRRRCELADLLGQIGRRPAALKLLILDAGHLDCDPRLALVVNEFPQILQTQLAGWERDPDLWVLTANRPLQTSHASIAAGRSVFGYYVTEGLKGAADRQGNKDDYVDLAELYRYVCRGVYDFRVRETGSPEAQTPWLLNCRMNRPDLLALAEDHVLVPTSEPEPAGEGEAEAENGGSKPDQPEPKDLADKKVRDFVERLWELPDGLGDRPADAESGKPWSAVDYAPHQWRHYMELLVRRELRYRLGMESDGSEMPPPPVQTDLPPGEEEIRELIRLKNELVFRAPYYVRWYVRASRAAGTRLPHLHQPIAEVLNRLPEFAEKLGDLQQYGLDRRPPGSLADAFDRLQEMAGPLRKLQAQLQEAVDKEVIDLAQSPKASNNADRAEALLSVPLLSAEGRIKLIEALNTLGPPNPEIGASVDLEDLDRDAQEFTRRQWALLPEQAELEMQLVVLAAGRSMRQEIPLPGKSSHAEQPWEAYSQFGDQLRAFYRRLPEEVNRLADEKDPQATRSAERMLRLVDARDAARIGSTRAEPMVHRSIALLGSLRRPAVNVFGPPQPPRFQRDGEEWVASLPVTIRTVGVPADEAELTLDYDRRYLQIKRAGQPVSSGAPQEVPLTRQKPPTGSQHREAVLRYDAVALVDDRKADSCEVTATVLVGGRKPPSYTIRLDLPAPDLVDLAVYRTGATGDVPVEKDRGGRIPLRPFPGRDTSFQLKLINLSDENKSVSVKLFGLPDVRPGQVPPGDPEDVGELLAEAEMGPLPKGRPMPVGFKPLAAKPSSPETEKVPPENPASENEPQPQPKPHVWACVISEKNDAVDKSVVPDNSAPASSRPEWVYWIDLRPVAPSQYVHCTADSAYHTGPPETITMKLKVRGTGSDGKPNTHVPVFSKKAPIAVAWNTDEAVGLKTVGTKGSLASAEAVADLSASVDPDQLDDNVAVVQLDVDGYARALSYDVPCDLSEPIYESNHPLVRITSPTSGDSFRMDQPIPLEFRVDAPSNAFQSDADAVSVQLIAQGGSLEPRQIGPFFSDRQVKILLQEVTAAGVVKLRADVGDFQIEVKDHGMDNTKARIRVALESDRGVMLEAGRRLEDSVEISFDGRPPELLPGRPLPGVQQGDPLELDLQWKDVSGVEKIELSVHTDRSGKMPDGKKVTSPPGPGADGKWHVVVPTKELKPGPYWLLVRAVDRAQNSTPTLRRPFTVRSPPPESTTGKITGRIASEDGKPRPNVKVTLAPSGKTATTDANGQFIFAGVLPGKYTLMAKGSIGGQSASKKREVVVEKGKVAPANMVMSMFSRAKD